MTRCGRFCWRNLISGHLRESFGNSIWLRDETVIYKKVAYGRGTKQKNSKQNTMRMPPVPSFLPLFILLFFAPFPWLFYTPISTIWIPGTGYSSTHSQHTTPETLSSKLFERVNMWKIVAVMCATKAVAKVKPDTRFKLMISGVPVQQSLCGFVIYPWMTSKRKSY